MVSLLATARGNNGAQVFCISELVTSIAGFLEPPNQVNLMRTCQTISKAVAPLVWTHVYGVQHLLNLIDGVIAEVNEGTENCKTMNLQSGLVADRSFKRFDVYAPFIKTITMYGRHNKRTKIRGWWTLISRNRQHTLLPNLRHMIFRSTSNCGPDVGMWVQALGSRSLVAVSSDYTSFGCVVPTVSYSMASFLLKSILEICSNVQSLGVFPDASIGEAGQDGENHLLTLLSPRLFYEHLTDFSQLKNLDTTTAWFRPDTLLVLSQIPQLESLVVNGNPREDVAIFQDWLLPGSFPSLQSLSLNRIHPGDLSDLLSVQLLVGRLYMLKLEFDAHLIKELGNDINQREWLYQNIWHPLRVINTLTKIIVNADTSCKFFTQELGAESLLVLRALPLEAVYLNGFKFSEDILNTSLGLVWPNVTVLQMPQQRATLSILVAFASLPKLQELELILDLNRDQALPNLTIVQPSSSMVLLRASAHPEVRNSICTNFIDLDYVARVLLCIWPNLQVQWSKPFQRALLPEEMTWLDRAQFLNSYLATLRELKTLQNAVGAPHKVVYPDYVPPSEFKFCN